nr:hypothetical protein [Tanacetum cinerariifolium]
MAKHPFDERYKLVLRKISSLKAKQPKKHPSKRARNVGKSKCPQLMTSSSTKSPPSDNKDLPSTKLSPRSYNMALKDDPIMSKEQKETIGIFKNLGLLAQKEIDIKEGLKLKAYEISVVKEKHDELVKQSFLTKSHYKGLVKEKTMVITDLKLKEEKDIDKMISTEKQLMFLNEIVYKRNQSIQTIHMLALKGLKFNGKPVFTNPMYLKKAQSEMPCLYEIPYDTSDPANRSVPNREETLTLKKRVDQNC